MSNAPILIAAGGTGGHIFPALAIARALRERDIPVQWVGSPGGMEATVVPEASFDLHTIKVTALRGRGLRARLRSVVNVVRALVLSAGLIRRVKPRAVLGMGGYVSGPVCLAARLCGKRLLVHEQNAVSGYTNRILKRFANRVLEAVPGTFAPASDVVHTGNPVRREILAIDDPQQRLGARLSGSSDEAIRLLVLGGSQGAQKLNETVPAALQAVPVKLEIRHQAGASRQAQTQQLYQNATHQSSVVQFIDEMAEAYGWADLVICRAGAMTVAELAAAGVASILVPFPYAVDDHQTANARHLERAGAAVIMQESEMNDARLAELVSQLCGDRPALLQMALAARKLACGDATQRIVNELLEQNT
jgi:UDP-N-acetylglucosamine--N-acetylmuramyl-(pentapeptide) pyrophosphoryl-undecaprenol N-acetylglucosamine transferase